MAVAQRRVGTSGWFYSNWRGSFYPDDLSRGKELEYYTTVFDTVELNASFYHMPKEKTARGWHDRTPDEFLFAIKGNRYISHRQKLDGCEEPLARFIQSIEPMGEKVGPILWQLPPGFHEDSARLADFLSLRPTDQRWAWEFRHESWFCDETYALLQQHNCALVWADTPEYPLETVVTADFLYARLHGHEKLYVSNYNDEQLHWWAEQLTQAAGEDRDIFVYFDNDAEGYAPQNALTLRQMLEETSTADDS